mmetsp:Transcript_3781/g.8156  ORF Transcript_3781/g.8156 Transcript_3781/m.8156 type:complete len:83 (-) Transcript_3781:103-351(-)
MASLIEKSRYFRTKTAVAAVYFAVGDDGEIMANSNNSTPTHSERRRITNASVFTKTGFLNCYKLAANQTQRNVFKSFVARSQ